VYESAYRASYGLVVITLTRLPCVVTITAAVLLTYLAYRLRARPPKRAAWPAICAVLALYGFLAALAPGGWNEPLVLLGVIFAALAGYTRLDPTTTTPSAGAAETSGRSGWFG
jgi:hypothetical protein